MASHSVHKWMPFKIHKTVILHNTLWIYVCMRSSKVLVGVVWLAIDGPGIYLGVCPVFVSVCFHLTLCLITHHYNEPLILRGFYHFISYHIIFTKTPTNRPDRVHCSGSSERAISLFMDPAWCLSVTDWLRHRQHHLAPHVAFNGFPVKDVSVMLLLLFSLLSRQPQMKMVHTGLVGPKLILIKM